ncbi:MAG: epsM [Bryobacterales bacterium]|nr:epsM [Bryobacterales bacterium]
MQGKILKPIVVLGSGGYSQELLWIIDDLNERQSEWDFLGFVDPKSPQRKGSTLYGRTVLGGFETAAELPANVSFACGIGSPEARQKECTAAERLGWKPATLIHPTVVRARYCEIGEGTSIGPGSILGPNCHIGRHCAINMHVGVGHDARLGDFVVLSPGVRISGNVDVETGAFLGSNATVFLGKKVGAGALVGANSFLLTNLAPGRSAIGVPARPFGDVVGGGICSNRESVRVPEERSFDKG